MSKQTVILGEYDSFFVNVLTKALTSSVSGIRADAPFVIAGGHGALHHYAFYDTNGNAYVTGDNRNNIALNGQTGTVPLTKVPVANVKQVQAYCNGGGSDGLNNGVAFLTKDGELYLTGSTESGFRNDGTPGNASEPAPYLVPLPEPILEIAIGSYCFALGASGKVYQWGGTLQNAFWQQFSCGRCVPSPVLSKHAELSFPEPIVHIAGGSNTNYAVGQSGRLYGWAYRPLYLGLSDLQELKIFDITTALGLPMNIAKLVVGPEGSYLLTTDGLLYSWGNNTQGACGNGQEGVFANFKAPWGYDSAISIFVTKPYLINGNASLPAGTKFTNIWASIGDAFYAFAEDAAGHVWAWGRNKGRVIPDGKNTGSSQQNADFPNTWDVLSPEKLTIIPVPVAVPVASIAPVSPITLPDNLISLDGSGSADSGGQIAGYIWSQISGPTAVVIGTGSQVQVLLSAAGIYVFQLTVTDNQGAKNAAQISILVKPVPACPPVPAPRVASTIAIPFLGQTVIIPAAEVKITYADGSIQ